MKTRCLVCGLLVVSLCGLALPVAAQSDAVYLGALSAPFATLSAEGEFTYPGELDWYAFDVMNDGTTIHVLSTGTGGEPGIRTLLFDAEGAYVDTAAGQILKAALAAGRYRLRIDSVESDASSYSLVVWNGVESESNDGLLESNNLGSVAAPVVLIASLLPRGDADVFSFEIPETGLAAGENALLIETEGASNGDTALVLYRFSASEGRYLPIASDDDSGDGYWSRLLLHPETGDRYAVRVEETAFPLDGIDEYLLALTPLALGADAEPNDTATQGVVLVPTSPDASSWTTDGLLYPDDVIDFYTLTIATRSLVQIWTGPQSGGGDSDTVLSLYSPEGDRLAENDDAGDSSWSRITIPLEPGSYAIAVEASSPGVSLLPYRLQATTQGVKVVSEAEPNDDPETAELIERPAGEALLVQGAIEPEGDIDAFRFVVSEETTVVFQIGPRAGATEVYDTTLTVYDEDLEEVAYNDDSDEGWSRIEETLAPGTYHVVVESYYSDEAFEYALLMTEL